MAHRLFRLSKANQYSHLVRNPARAGPRLGTLDLDRKKLVKVPECPVGHVMQRQFSAFLLSKLSPEDFGKVGHASDYVRVWLEF